LFYTHNDSGSEAALYAFSAEGGRVQRWPLPGVEAVDFEGLSAGPCPDQGSCLYVGDIGDNLRRRDRVQVYAIREDEQGLAGTVLAKWDLAYPSGAHDAEVLLVHPQTGRISIVTKGGEMARVFVAPLEPGVGQLEEVAVLDEATVGRRLPKLTGGDFSPDGTRVVLRGYLSAWEWVVDPRNDGVTHWKTAPHKKVPLRLERQGEAIAYDSRGRLFTSSEGSPMPLTRIGCND